MGSTTTSTPMRYYIYQPPRVRRPASLASGEDAEGARRREGTPGERAMSTRRASALRHMSATAVRRWSSSTSCAKKGARGERRRSRAEGEAARGGRLDGGGVDGVGLVTLVIVDGRNNGDGGKRDVNGNVRFVASVGRRRAAPVVVFVDEASRASFSSPSSPSSSASSRALVARAAMRRSRRRRNASINSSLASRTARACASALARARSRACIANDSDVSARHARIARSFARRVSSSHANVVVDVVVVVVVIRAPSTERDRRGRPSLTDATPLLVE